MIDNHRLNFLHWRFKHISPLELGGVLNNILIRQAAREYAFNHYSREKVYFDNK